MTRVGTMRAAGAALALVATLMLAPGAARAVQVRFFNLTGVALGGCNVNNTSSCVGMAQVADYPDPTQFTVEYDVDNKSGNFVPMEITNFFIPSINPLGGITSTEEFNVNGAGFPANPFNPVPGSIGEAVDPLDVTPPFDALGFPLSGFFNIVTGEVSLGFAANGLNRRRDGVAGDPFAFPMTTGSNTLLAGSPCGNSVDVPVPGLPHQNPGDPSTASQISIIGHQCIDILAGPGSSWEILAVSITGTLRPPDVPEPGTLALLAVGFAGLFWRGRRLH